jgi:hypothetical protein
MKSASLIVDPHQTYDSLKDLGGRLNPAPGWKFRAVVLDQDLVLTRMTEPPRSPRTSWETPTTGSAAPTATTSREVRHDRPPGIVFSATQGV